MIYKNLLTKEKKELKPKTPKKRRLPLIKNSDSETESMSDNEEDYSPSIPTPTPTTHRDMIQFIENEPDDYDPQIYNDSTEQLIDSYKRRFNIRN